MFKLFEWNFAIICFIYNKKSTVYRVIYLRLQRIGENLIDYLHINWRLAFRNVFNFSWRLRDDGK